MCRSKVWLSEYTSEKKTEYLSGTLELPKSQLICCNRKTFFTKVRTVISKIKVKNLDFHSNKTTYRYRLVKAHSFFLPPVIWQPLTGVASRQSWYLEFQYSRPWPHQTTNACCCTSAGSRSQQQPSTRSNHKLITIFLPKEFCPHKGRGRMS